MYELNKKRNLIGYIRFHQWDDTDRLRMVLGPKEGGYYSYDAHDSRVYKLTGVYSTEEINGNYVFSCLNIEDAVMYPSPYITITPKKYTKHYFAGSERIATVIGDGQWIHAKPIDGWHDAHDMDIALYFKYPEWGYPLGEQGYTYTVQNEDINGRVQEELAYDCEPAILKLLYWKMPGPLLKEVMTRYTEPHWDEGKIYYYHGDHLGSASWITDAIGAPAQYLHYLPYGELYANQVLSFKERFKFTGKELDEESGYYNFEARQLLSEYAIFSKVDPLADETPQIQPYLYCNGNPVKYIDPDGKELIVSFNIDPSVLPYSYKKNLYLTYYAKKHYGNNSPIIHFWAHGAPNHIRLKDGTAIRTPQKMYEYLNELSREFKANYSAGKPSVIVFHSCSTGSGENSFAQQISADEHFSNTLIIAPSSILDVGTKEIIENSGFWIVFYKGVQVGTINAYDTPWYKIWGEQKEAVQLKELFENMTIEQIFKLFNIDVNK